jgi:hypothetical protein
VPKAGPVEADLRPRTADPESAVKVVDVTRTKRVTDAMLKMVKLDVALLERAYRGN